MRYEGGNGVTHADVLFGDNISLPRDDRSHNGSANGSYRQIGFGVVHSADSIAGTPNIHPSLPDSLNATGAFATHYQMDSGSLGGNAKRRIDTKLPVGCIRFPSG